MRRDLRSSRRAVRRAGAAVATDTPTERERVIAILLRITDEQAPLFGSDRLRSLHADCRKLLDDMHKGGL